MEKIEREREWLEWKKGWRSMSRWEASRLWPYYTELSREGLRARRGYLSRVMPVGEDRRCVMEILDVMIEEN